MIAERLNQAKNALAALLHYLEIPWDHVAEVEQSHRLTIEREVPCQSLVTVPFDVIKKFAEVFGRAGELEARVDDNVLARVDGEILIEDWESLHTATIGLAQCSVKIVIRKRTLAEEWCGPDWWKVRLFCDEQSLIRSLREWVRKPAMIEQHLWRDFDSERDPWKCGDVLHRAELHVAGCELTARGPFLAIQGSAYRGSASKQDDVACEEVERASDLWRLAKDRLNWADSLPMGLTPLHLQIDTSSHSDAVILQLLRAIRLRFAVMFLADRVTIENGVPIALITADRSKCSLMLPPTYDQEGSAVNSEAIERLAEMCQDCFRAPFALDRLRIARMGMVPALRFESPVHGLAQLVRHAAEITSDVAWHWEQFVAEKIDGYGKEQRELEDRVSKAVESLESRISDLIKAVSDTALATVGALVGSMIASVFGGKFNEVVFRTGVIAYAIYVLLFPGLYGLLHIGLRYHTASGSYAIEVARIARGIGQQRTAMVEGGRVGGCGTGSGCF